MFQSLIHISPTYVLFFSIAIIRSSASGGTRLLGKAEASSRAVLASVLEHKESKGDIELAASECYADVWVVVSLDLDKVNDDGPSLTLKAGFSAQLSKQCVVFYQTDVLENKSKSLVVFS